MRKGAPRPMPAPDLIDMPVAPRLPCVVVFSQEGGRPVVELAPEAGRGTSR